MQTLIKSHVNGNQFSFFIKSAFILSAAFDRTQLASLSRVGIKELYVISEVAITTPGIGIMNRRESSP